MKKIILVFAFLLSGFIAQAQELNWYTDINKATEASLKEKKPLMLFFTGSDWCGWCTKLQRDVLKKDEFFVWATENVILVELDYPKYAKQEETLKLQNQNIAREFSVSAFPTVIFVNPILSEGSKVNLTKLGSLGYDKSASNWITNANTFLANK